MRSKQSTHIRNCSLALFVLFTALGLGCAPGPDAPPPPPQPWPAPHPVPPGDLPPALPPSGP